MSKNNNANPNSYKTAGREPQGQGFAHDVARQEYAKEKAQEKPVGHRAAPLKKGKPAREPVPESGS
jgi:hypothetical protein